MSIYKTRLSCEYKIQSLGSTTLTAGPDTLLTLDIEAFGGIRSIAAIFNTMVLAGATTITWYGGTTTSGGSLTAIATLTLTSAHDAAFLQIDAEDISEAAEVAGLAPEGFKSLVLKIDGANSDTIKSCYIIDPLHKRSGLTPSDVVALT